MKHKKELQFLSTILLGLFLLGMVFIKLAHASFDYGVDTYATDGSQLIINSTGDQVTSSTLGNLGTNDFIGELGVKNTLLMDGYSVAYDSNNPTALAQCYNQYNQALPIGVTLTQLQFTGLNGDPRALQNVYVLTSEYNRLSAQGQANSIDTLNTAVTNNINAINAEQTARYLADNGLSNSISNETNRATSAENALGTSIGEETGRALGAEIGLQNNINTETTQRIAGDNQLQSNINTVDNNSIIRDNQLNNNINSVSNRVDNLDNRVGKLEKTQFKLQVGVRIFDSKRVQVVPYISQDFTRGCVDEAGIRVTLKLGQSYEEKLIAKQNQRLEALEKKIGSAPVMREVVNQKGEVQSMSISEDGVISVNKQF